MDKGKFLEFYYSHRGGINGSLIGFAIAVFILKVGFFSTLFIALFVGIGYYVGKKLSADRDYIKKLLDKVLPPGTYR